MKKFKRTTIFHVNRAQRIFFYPVIVAFFLGCIVSWLSLSYFVIGEYIQDSDFDQLRRVIPILLVATSTLMIVVLFWTLRISNRHFGSFNRIIDDLDGVISGARKLPLETRRGDVIFEKLLKRINVLIEKTR